MPRFSKFNKSKKRRFRRRSSKKFGNGFKKAVQKVLEGEAEHKYIDINILDNNVLVGPTSFQISNIDEGVGTSNRIGTKIKTQKLKLRFNFVLASSNSVISARIYVIQLLDEDTPIGLPTALELMPTSQIAVNPYKILYDSTMQLSLGVNEIPTWQINITDIEPIEWVSNSPTVYVKGAIVVFVATTNSTADSLTFNVSGRLFWTDP